MIVVVIHRLRTLVNLKDNPNRRRNVLIFAMLAVALAMFIGASQLLIAYQRIPSGLEYDGIREFRIANQHVTIETKSLSLGNGDDGDAEIIVSTEKNAIKLPTKFSDDMWTFIRPAYISWENVDGHSAVDLLIWKPTFSTHGPLKAEEYISSEDGELHVLQVPIERPIPGH